MKQQWAPNELLDHWTLTDEEVMLVKNISQTEYNRLGVALLLKYFQIEGKFPQRKQDIPLVIVEHIAQQLHIASNTFTAYQLKGRSVRRHQLRIRQLLQFRAGTVRDAKDVLTWLLTHDQLLEEHNFDRLKEIVYERYKELKIQPPQPKRIERLVRSAVREADNRLYTKMLQKLSLQNQKKLEALLSDTAVSENTSILSSLKSEAGAATLESVLDEVGKLKHIRSLSLPPDLFAGVSRKRLLWCKRRIAVEDLTEIRRHPPQVRYSLLAAFCIVRTEEITDTLVELLIHVIHKIGSRAKHVVNKEVIKEIKRVQGKNKLLYEVASASLDSPDGTVKEVIYPVAGEETLRALVAEYKQNGLYDQRVQTIMRGSYSNHYRRMVPRILQSLSFHATNETSGPIVDALDLMRKYADKNTAFYPENEVIPFEGVVKSDQLEMVQQGRRINRINYELCTLQVAREKLRCKEVYVQGASRYRNPDEDLPTDFAAKRTEYYADLQKPLSADKFIATQKRELQDALTMLDRGMPKNKSVEITKKNGKPWIKVASLDPQPEPKNLASLKAEVGRRWSQIYLLDMLKEADLRIGFTNLFKSSTQHEILSRATLQIRLLLDLYGLGTNAGIKRVASGAQVSYRDLLYVLHRFISKDSLRAAIAEIANAVLRERNVAIWGEATSCASDSKKFGAWDQNLLTEWHIRYRGPGIMIYLSEASDKYTYLNDCVMRRSPLTPLPYLTHLPLSFA